LGRTVARDARRVKAREASTAHKRIQITIETEWVMTIRRRASSRLWCPKCGREVGVVDLIQAELLTGIDQATLHAGAEAKRWHSFTGPDGTLLVCLESVLKSM
jgi:hypothetical protein